MIYRACYGGGYEESRRETLDQSCHSDRGDVTRDKEYQVGESRTDYAQDHEVRS